MTTTVATTEAEQAVNKVFGQAPTPKQVDALCLAYDTAAAKVAVAEADRDAAKTPLLDAVQRWGVVPPNAERTHRLKGVLYVADATAGTKIEMSEPAIERLQQELKRRKKGKLFPQLFSTTVKHSLERGAAELLALEIGAMPEDVRSQFTALFAQCFDVSTKAPAVNVCLVKALEEKEQKKAARTAKKTKPSAMAKKGRA